MDVLLLFPLRNPSNSSTIFPPIVISLSYIIRPTSERQRKPLIPVRYWVSDRSSLKVTSALHKMVSARRVLSLIHEKRKGFVVANGIVIMTLGFCPNIVYFYNYENWGEMREPIYLITIIIFDL